MSEAELMLIIDALQAIIKMAEGFDENIAKNKIVADVEELIHFLKNSGL